MASEINLEIIGPLNMYVGMGIKICSAIFCGGLIGLDRELKMKPAGIKTNVLICLGSTLYTSVAILNHLYGPGVTPFDPNRTVAQIVSGIGFLGAGAIIHGKGEFVTGLTTAATIWTVAAVGVTIGTGYVFVALIFTITVLVVLWLIDPIFSLLNIMSATHMEILSMGSVSGVVKAIVEMNNIQATKISEDIVDSDKDIRVLHLKSRMNARKLKSIVSEVQSLPQVKRVNYKIVQRR